MPFEVTIFNPSIEKKKHLIEKISLVSFLIIICTIFLLVLFNFPDHFESVLINIAVVFTFIGLFIIPIASFYSYQVLNGQLEGQLIIYEMFVDINGNKINILEIKFVELSLDDRYENNKTFLFNSTPKISQGVNNYILIKTKDNKEVKVYFRIDRLTNRRELNPFILQLIKHRTIPFERGIEIMQFKTKEEIEQLRANLLS